MGIATSSILANIGEDGKEAVIPLTKSNLWAPQLASEITKQLNTIIGINSLSSNSSNNNSPVTIKLEINERELGKATIKSINDLQKSSGQILLEL